MARSKKPKGYGTRPGSPSRVRQAGVKQASAAANTGMVWPVPYPKAHATALAMQFKFQASEWWSSDRLLANQLRQVDCLLRHALKTVPYYREKFQGHPAVSGAPLTVEEFRQLPLLQRTDIQTAGKALVSKALPESHGKAFEVKSSGSTGRPIQVLGTDLTNMYVAALTMRGHLWHRRDGTCRNVDIRTAKAAGARRQSVWMPVPDAGKSIRLDINSPIDKLLDQLVVEDPVYLQTHPHTLMGLIEDSTARGLLPRRACGKHGHLVRRWRRTSGLRRGNTGALTLSTTTARWRRERWPTNVRNRRICTYRQNPFWWRSCAMMTPRARPAKWDGSSSPHYIISPHR
jgi:hypothetical protein